jgi:hypothetical protein
VHEIGAVEVVRSYHLNLEQVEPSQEFSHEVKQTKAA